MQRLEPIYEQLNPIATNTRCVLSHRDLWAKNIMFTFAADEHTGSTDYDRPVNCVLVDYQICRYLSPAQDVQQLLALTTRPADRKQHRIQYLRWYHQSLRENLQRMADGANIDVDDLLSFSELERNASELQLLSLVFAGIYVPLIYVPDDEVLKLKNTNLKKYDYMANVKRDEFVLEMMDKYGEYKQVVLDQMAEILEFMYEEK